MAHLDVDVDTDIDMDVDVVGSAWGSRPGGQWYHSCDSCGPTTTRAWFFLLPPQPPDLWHIWTWTWDVDVDADACADVHVVFLSR